MGFFSHSSNRSLFLIFCIVLMEFTAFGMIIPLSPYLAREFGADDLQVGLLMSVYSLAQLLIAPVWGYLSDKWGRKPVLLICLSGVSLFHLWFSVAESLKVLFLTRLFCGVFGAVMSVAMAAIADVTQEKERSKNMGLIGAAIGLGFVIGPFLGGIFGALGQRWGTTPPLGQSFSAFCAFLLCLINVFVTFFFLRESVVPTKKVFRYSLSQIFLDLRKIHQYRVQQMAQAIQYPVLKQILLMYFLLTLALAGIEAALFLYVKDEFLWSHFLASIGFTYIGLMMVFTQGFLVRKWIPVFGERNTVLLGFIIGGLGFISVGFIKEWWHLAISVTFMCVGYGLSSTGLSGAVSLLSHTNRQGNIFGVHQSLFALSRIIGPALGGWLYRDLSHSAPFYLSGSLMFIALLLIYNLDKQLFPQKGKTI